MTSQGWWEGYHYLDIFNSAKNLNLSRKLWEWPWDPPLVNSWDCPWPFPRFSMSGIILCNNVYFEKYKKMCFIWKYVLKLYNK